jgi:16S rRNA (guanine966-N2)-methyltransferase
MTIKHSNTSVRIIGGEWRGRRLPVLDLPGLRPSGDRCRETLFNWLQPYLPGARCADLFAGSGALGLEAASRGAADVILVEKNSAVVSSLDLNINHLFATQVRVVERDALKWLSQAAPESLDIVFVDPPFDEGLTPLIMEMLDHVGCVREGGFVYFETALSRESVMPGPGWSPWREKTLGEVRMQLFRRAARAS